LQQKIKGKAMLSRLLSLLLALLLAACGPSGSKSVSPVPHLDGKYQSDDGKRIFNFTTDGTVSSNFFGEVKTTTYKMEGNAVIFKFQDGLPATFTINADGSLTSQTHTQYKKRT
jgi:hypothetical protein